MSSSDDDDDDGDDDDDDDGGGDGESRGRWTRRLRDGSLPLAGRTLFVPGRSETFTSLLTLPSP